MNDPNQVPVTVTQPRSSGGVPPRLLGRSPGQIGAPGPVLPGITRLYQNKITQIIETVPIPPVVTTTQNSIFFGSTF